MQEKRKTSTSVFSSLRTEFTEIKQFKEERQKERRKRSERMTKTEGKREEKERRREEKRGEREGKERNEERRREKSKFPAAFVTTTSIVGEKMLPDPTPCHQPSRNKLRALCLYPCAG